MPEQALQGIRIGFAMTGSFCTFSKAMQAAKRLIESGAELIPIFSEAAAKTDTRFGTAQSHLTAMADLCGRQPILSITEAEPIGPKQLTDLFIVAPCTGNTAAKLAAGITDTTVTMAVKSHLRGAKPVLLCIASNDALAAGAQNIGILMNRKQYFFVPLRQDDPTAKPTSLVADFSKLPEAAIAALSGIQLQPILAPYA